MRVIGYVRVSTEGQGDSGAGLDAQRAAIETECARRGWELDRIATDVASGKSLSRRPELTKVMADLDIGNAGTLMAAKLDRLARSSLDFAGIMARAEARRWSVVCLDVAVDTTTPSGELMATVVAAFAQYERRLISQRTRDGLAAKAAAGVRIGRPRTLGSAIRQRIVAEHAAGAGWTTIARGLNADGVPTAQGGATWYPATVRKVATTATEPMKEARKVTSG